MRKPKWKILQELDAFTTGYIECMLWSSTDMADDSGGSPLDDNYSEQDIARKSLLSIVADCNDFQESNAVELDKAYEHNKPGFDGAGYDESAAGHDFWLTRNGHGAGFWDRGLPNGDVLTKAAKVYGNCNPYVWRKRVYL